MTSYWNDNIWTFNCYSQVLPVFVSNGVLNINGLIVKVKEHLFETWNYRSMKYVKETIWLSIPCFLEELNIHLLTVPLKAFRWRYIMYQIFQVYLAYMCIFITEKAVRECLWKIKCIKTTHNVIWRYIVNASQFTVTRDGHHLPLLKMAMLLNISLRQGFEAASSNSLSDYPF